MSLPNSVNDVMRFLRAAGLVWEELRDGPGPNEMLLYHGPVVDVRIVSDRGIWYIECSDSRGNQKEWYDVALVKLLLCGDTPDILTIEEQAQFVVKCWNEVLDLFEPSNAQDTHSKLSLLRQERMRRRLPNLRLNT